MDVSAVRLALANTIKNGVTSTPKLTCLPYVPDKINPPVLYVQPETIEFNKAYARGQDDIPFLLMLLVSRTDDQASQKLLDAYISGSGPASVYAALFAQRGTPSVPALGGVADSVHCTGVRAYRWYTYGTDKFLGAEFTVIVRGPGT